MAFTDIFIKRPVLSVVVSMLILLIGLRAAMVLPIRQYPKLSNTVVNVTTSYPGASAQLIQGFITTPIEQAVASAEGVDYITSSSVLGTSTIQVYIKLNFDPNQALTEVLAKVNSVKYLIPKESNDPIVTKTTGQTTAVMYIGFSSEELTGSAISDYLTRVVQPVLSTVDGVASADILGGQTFAMRLWLDLAGRRVGGDRRQQFPGSGRPVQGVLHRLQRLDQYRPAERPAVQAHDRQGQGRRLRAHGGYCDRRARSAEHGRERRLQRRARDLYRRAGNPARQPADHRQGRARAVPGAGTQPAAVDEDEGGLRFHEIHPVVDR
jgi:hypothetical protein